MKDSMQTLGVRSTCYKTYEKRMDENPLGQEAQERGPGEAVEAGIGEKGGGRRQASGEMDHPKEEPSRSAEEDKQILGLSQTRRIKKGIIIR